MPSRKLTLLIIPENTSRVKQFKFSRAFVTFVACFCLLGLGAVSFVVHDYLNLKNSIPARQALEREVTNQRIQIQAFAKRIRALRSEMIALRDFERKIRVFANVNEPAGQDAVFGIGGTIPEDLDSNLPIDEKHNSLVRQMHTQVQQLTQAAAIQKLTFEELQTHLQGQKSLLASTPAIRPTTGWMSSGFGYRISPFTGLKEFHRGIDIATRQGTPVIAPADGIVVLARKKGGLGRMMQIDHGHGMVTRYGHLKEWLVRSGDQVKRGDKMALVGNTGRSTAPHLHYEVHLNGIPVNPANYILN